MDFAVGDRYLSSVGSKVAWRCVFVYNRGEEVFPFFEKEENHLSEPFFFDLPHIEENWTKIIPFFEKGKSYVGVDYKYNVIAVFEKDGQRAAMAEAYESDEFQGFVHLDKWNFGKLTEV